MGLFKKLFAKQPGGSIFGNLIRGVGDKFTGGLVSAVLPAPPKDGGKNTGIASPLLGKPESEKPSFMDKLKSKWAYVVGGVVGLGLVVWFIFKGKKRSGKSRA